MTKQILGFVLSALLFALGLPAEAQQPKKLARIGFVSGGPGDQGFEAFRQGFRELGYVEGDNVVIEYRDAKGRLDLMPALG